METILFASTNRGKFSELKALCEGYRVSLLSPEDVVGHAGASVAVSRQLPEVEESEPTYEGNALKKARSAAAWVRAFGQDIPALADDTGLEVDALSGAPGLFSARFAGPGATAQDNRDALRRALMEASSADLTQRFSARFVCVLALVWPAGREVLVRETLEGFVVLKERGQGGFGYDSLFEVVDTRKTLAELKADGSVVQTHRHKALQSLMRELETAPA